MGSKGRSRRLTPLWHPKLVGLGNYLTRMGRRASLGPVARIGIAAAVGTSAASVAFTVGVDVIVVGTTNAAAGAAVIGIAVAFVCQLGLATVALVAPEDWRTTRSG
mgnify:CR=1 FL=1